MVGDLNEKFKVGELVADRRDPWRELSAVDQRASLRVVQQIDEFGFDVAVVDVEGSDPGPIGPDHRFQVFVAVAQVQSDVILTRFVALQAITFGVTSQARRREVMCDAVDAGVQLCVRPFPVPPDQ